MPPGGQGASVCERLLRQAEPLRTIYGRYSRNSQRYCLLVRINAKGFRNLNALIQTKQHRPFRSARLLPALCALAFWIRALDADEPGAHALNAESQAAVARLIQNAIGPFRSAELKMGATNNPSGYYTNVEASFREASRLMPNRLDLRFGIASTLLGQALQTNTQFDVKIKDALEVYRQIWALDTNGFEAPMLYAAYTRAIGDTNASHATVYRLMNIHPDRTRDYLDRFRRVDALLKTVPNPKPDKTFSTNKDHAIVILGAALETNGIAKIKLVERLKKGLKLARVYPEAPIILTGGNQRAGVTEAYVMARWLRKKGVAPARLYLEDQARDTVGNAIFSAVILQKLGVTQVTVVTSSTHIRRGLIDLQEACLQRGLTLHYSNLAAKEETALDEKIERLATYRDVMRVSGFWTYPGVLR
jgi:hypothetical protein